MEHKDRIVPPFIEHNTPTMVIIQPAQRPLHWSVLLGTAILVTLFLYFIDEGRYSLEDLFTTSNLVAMAVYFIGLLLGLLIVALAFARRTPGPARTMLTLTLGTILGFGIGLGFILGCGFLMSL